MNFRSLRSASSYLRLGKLMRGAASLWSHFKSGPVICTRSGIRYELDLSQTIDRNIYFGGWELDTIQFLKETLRFGSTVIEVGANIGAHTLLIASLIHPAPVYAFEPTAYARRKLLRNISLNPRLDNVIVRSELVTNGNHDIPTRELASQFPATGQYVPEMVSSLAVSIDEFARELSSLTLLKIDVDGYDFKVLEGAKETIKRLHPAVFIELSDANLRQKGDSVADVVSLLSHLGYAPDLSTSTHLASHQGSFNGIFRFSG